MAAMDEIAILLQGRNAEANRHRAWRVEAGRDLFGKWMVRVSFGRIGCRGRTFARKFASEDEARAYVHDGLRRRKGAIRRCRVEYCVVEASPTAEPLLDVVGLSRGEGRRNSQVSPCSARSSARKARDPLGVSPCCRRVPPAASPGELGNEGN